MMKKYTLIPLTLICLLLNGCKSQTREYQSSKSLYVFSPTRGCIDTAKEREFNPKFIRYIYKDDCKSQSKNSYFILNCGSGDRKILLIYSKTYEDCESIIKSKTVHQ